jgi:hypothetical protein
MNQKDTEIAEAIANFILNGAGLTHWGNDSKSLAKQYAKRYLPTLDGKYAVRGLIKNRAQYREGHRVNLYWIFDQEIQRCVREILEAKRCEKMMANI